MAIGALPLGVVTLGRQAVRISINARIAIELSASQTKDFAVVVAYEVARYLAQRGDGVIVDLEAKLTHVPDGGFSDLS